MGRVLADGPGRPVRGPPERRDEYVATDRPKGLGWGQVVALGAGIAGGVRGLKAGGGPDLVVWGSTTVTPVLFGEGLVDEVVLGVIPVLLGRGKRFFSDSVVPQKLALVSTHSTPTGVLINTYRRGV